MPIKPTGRKATKFRKPLNGSEYRYGIYQNLGGPCPIGPENPTEIIEPEGPKFDKLPILPGTPIMVSFSECEDSLKPIDWDTIEVDIGNGIKISISPGTYSRLRSIATKHVLDFNLVVNMYYLQKTIKGSLDNLLNKITETLRIPRDLAERVIQDLRGQ